MNKQTKATVDGNKAVVQAAYRLLPWVIKHFH